MQRRLIIVGCGKTKLAKPAAARDLYTGILFRAARAYAETFGDHWCIASAKHGLVDPDTILEPYDLAMADLDKDRVQQWGGWAQCGLIKAFQGMGVAVERGQWVDSPAVVILAGKDYVEPLVRWTFLRGHPVELPLAGLGIGKRIAWLKRQLKSCKV